MKKHQPAWSNMIRTLAFMLLIMGVLAIFLISPIRGWFTDPHKDTNMITIASDVVSFILLFIELCAVVIAVYGLHRYFRDHRPPVFIFKGFSNGPKLAEIGDVPVDLDNLAREELAYQFWLIYKKLGRFLVPEPPKEVNDTDNVQQSSTNQIEQSHLDSQRIVASHLSPKILSMDLYLEETRPQDEDEWPLPGLDVESGILGREKAKWLVQSLKETMENSKVIDPANLEHAINLLDAIEQTTPQGITSIMSFIDVIFPVRTITVTCHLQWRDDSSEGIGITFEVTDSKKEGISFTQTIWSNSTNSAEGQQKLAERYLKLLKPAMRWLGLLFWEQDIRLLIPKNDKKGYLQALFYLLGVLCFDYADCFPLCSDFFNQQAKHRLSKVMDNRYPASSFPYFVRAEINFYKASKTRHKNTRPLLLQAIRDYDQALKDIQRENGSRTSQNLIVIRRALAVLNLKNTYLIYPTRKQVDEMPVEEMIREGDPKSSRDEIEECSLCLANLAHWYAQRVRRHDIKNEEDAKEKIRRYFIYSFVRFPPSWYYSKKDANSGYKQSQDFFEKRFDKQFSKEYLSDGIGKGLWSALEKNRRKVPKLAKLSGQEFPQKVDECFSYLWKQGASASAEDSSVLKILVQTMRTIYKHTW